MDKYILPIILISAVVILFIFMRVKRMIKQKTIAEKIAEGATIIDVRSPAEFSGGHYKTAINIPVDKLQSNLSKAGTKDTPVIVYCASGMRSASAYSILKSAGFADVTNAGGFGDMPS